MQCFHDACFFCALLRLIRAAFCLFDGADEVVVVAFSGGSLGVSDEDFGFVLGVDAAELARICLCSWSCLAIFRRRSFSKSAGLSRGSVEVELGLVVMRAVAFGPVGLGVRRRSSGQRVRDLGCWRTC